VDPRWRRSSNDGCGWIDDGGGWTGDGGGRTRDGGEWTRDGGEWKAPQRVTPEFSAKSTGVSGQVALAVRPVAPL
jgi:hypothetical protein